jgi:hypothetical protein
VEFRVKRDGPGGEDFQPGVRQHGTLAFAWQGRVACRRDHADVVRAERDAILQMCDTSRSLPRGATLRQFALTHFGTVVIAAEFTRMLLGD